MPAHVQPPPASPADSSLAARVEGWVQYCEYFHLLDADMQAREFPLHESSFHHDGICQPL